MPKLELSDKQKAAVQQHIVAVNTAQAMLNTYVNAIADERGLDKTYTLDPKTMNFTKNEAKK